MMNRIFACAFAVIFVISILEVTTFNYKESNEYDESFNEIDENSSFDLSNKKTNYNEDELENENEIEIRQPTGLKPKNSFKTSIDIPPIRFLYCVSCGYRQAFDQLSQVLYEKYSGIQIEGNNYPPTTIKSVISQLIGFLKLILITFILANRDPFALLNIPVTPQFFRWMLNNKLSSCLMLFMVSNSIESMLMSTGAFEIYIGDEQIWSKLESGRPPSPGELIQSIDSYFAIKGKTLTESSFGFGNKN